MIPVVNLIILAVNIVVLYLLYQKHQGAEQNKSKIINEAHSKAKSIIAGAVEEATRELTKAQYMEQDLKEVLTGGLKAAAQKAEVDLTDRSKKLLEEISKEQLSSFKRLVSQQQQASRDLADQVIEQYKKERIAQIDSQINDFVHRIALQVLGKSISQQHHQRLIMEALDQARKEGIFDTIK